MDLTHVIRSVLGNTLGSAGAMRNCRVERLQRSETEAAVAQLCDRIPSAERTSEPASA